MQGTQGQVVRLPHLAGGYDTSSAKNISDDGFTIIGYADGGGNPRTGWYWNAVDGVVEIPVLPGYNHMEPYDCSADGSVIVGFCLNNGTNQYMPFLWSQATGTIELIASSTTDGATATGVSADGTIVVGTADPALASGGFIWTEATGTIELEIPPNPFGGDTHPCYAHSISGDGSVVGGFYDKFVGSQSFPPVLWDGSDGSLISVLNFPSGWVGTTAVVTSLSYDGTFGVGTNSSGSCNVSRHAKTIVSSCVHFFTWSGGVSTTKVSANGRYRTPVGGTPSLLTRGLPSGNSFLPSAGNGLVYATNVADESNPLKSQAIRFSMLV